MPIYDEDFMPGDWQEEKGEVDAQSLFDEAE